MPRKYCVKCGIENDTPLFHHGMESKTAAPASVVAPTWTSILQDLGKSHKPLQQQQSVF